MTLQQAADKLHRLGIARFNLSETCTGGGEHKQHTVYRALSGGRCDVFETLAEAVSQVLAWNGRPTNGSIDAQ